MWSLLTVLCVVGAGAVFVGIFRSGIPLAGKRYVPARPLIEPHAATGTGRHRAKGFGNRR